MAKHRGQRLEGIRSHGTDMGGDGYIHPRSDKYRENFDQIRWDRPHEGELCNCDCDGDCGETCCCLEDNGERKADS